MSNRRRPRRDVVQDTREFVPYTSGTDFDLEDVVLMVSESRAVILPRSLSRLGGEARAEARSLQQLGLQLQEIAEQIDAQVEQCRESGVSWSGIGWCLGTTGEAARQRWGVFDE